MACLSGRTLLGLVVVGMLGSALCASKYIEDTDRFPGWRGELPGSLNAAFEDTTGYGELGQEVWRGKVEQVSWKPRAFVYRGFLTDAECEHLKKLGNSTMRKSTVADSKTGRSVPSNVRTSTGTFLVRSQDPVVEAIERRIALVTMIPVENGEGLQLLRYVNGQKYEPHTDYFHDAVNQDAAHGGQRIATMLMYLSTPDEGGETVFPYAEKKVSGEGWSDCARAGNAVKAIKGDATFFYSLLPNGKEDPDSTHGSCPTLAGEKWSATKWMHVSEFSLGGNGPRVDPRCKDAHPRCEEWAIMGECKKNAAYMAGNCLKSCELCDTLKKRGRKDVTR